MPLKRSLSPTSSDSTSPPKKEKNAKSGKTDSPGKTASTWTAESKAVLIEQLLTVGFAQASMSDLAAQTGLSRRQISDAMLKGRHNLRSSVIEAARTAPACGKPKKA